jgi:hypothetical protein
LASTPTDLLPLFENGIAPPTQLLFVGHIRADLRLAVTLVGRDRPSVDREFEFAVEGLDKRTPALADLVKSAKVAWWAALLFCAECAGNKYHEVGNYLYKPPFDARILEYGLQKQSRNFQIVRNCERWGIEVLQWGLVLSVGVVLALAVLMLF